MWSPEPIGRRALVSALLLGPVGLAGCGFAPALAPGSVGAGLRGQVRVLAPATARGFRLRAALEDRLGAPAAGAPLILETDVTVRQVESAVGPTGAIARYTLEGRAPWRLGRAGTPLAEGEVQAFSGYSAEGSTVALRAAAMDAETRLMAQLAEAIMARLLLLEDLP